jgi:hypothetical protein
MDEPSFAGYEFFSREYKKPDVRGVQYCLEEWTLISDVEQNSHNLLATTTTVFRFSVTPEFSFSASRKIMYIPILKGWPSSPSPSNIMEPCEDDG